MKLKQRVLRGVVVGCLLAAASALLVNNVRINTTASAPRGIYLTLAGVSAPMKGQYVVTCLPSDWAAFAVKRGYVGRGECHGVEPLLKRVAAVEGDAVTVVGDGIFVNGVVVLPYAPMTRDSQGRALAPFPPGSYVVEPGTTWLISTYDPRSFDSRYFGPIAVNQLLSVATPIITE